MRVPKSRSIVILDGLREDLLDGRIEAALPG
jgi:hypothetical protein